MGRTFRLQCLGVLVSAHSHFGLGFGCAPMEGVLPSCCFHLGDSLGFHARMDLVDRRLFRFLIDPTWTFPDRPPRPRPFSAKLTSWSRGDRHVGEWRVGRRCGPRLAASHRTLRGARDPKGTEEGKGRRTRFDPALKTRVRWTKTFWCVAIRLFHAELKHVVECLEAGLTWKGVHERAGEAPKSRRRSGDAATAASEEAGRSTGWFRIAHVGTGSEATRGRAHHVHT